MTISEGENQLSIPIDAQDQKNIRTKRNQLDREISALRAKLLKMEGEETKQIVEEIFQKKRERDQLAGEIEMPMTKVSDTIETFPTTAQDSVPAPKPVPEPMPVLVPDPVPVPIPEPNPPEPVPKSTSEPIPVPLSTIIPEKEIARTPDNSASASRNAPKKRAVVPATPIEISSEPEDEDEMSKAFRVRLQRAIEDRFDAHKLRHISDAQIREALSVAAAIQDAKEMLKGLYGAIRWSREELVKLGKLGANTYLINEKGICEQESGIPGEEEENTPGI